MEKSKNLELNIINLDDESDIETTSENFVKLDKVIGEIIENTQEATEENNGIINLNTIKEMGIPNRGKLELLKTITYKELWDLPHGLYTVLSDTLAFLGLGGLYAGSLIIYPYIKDNDGDRTKLFEFYSHSIEVSRNPTGRAFLNLYKGTVDTYPNSKITDTLTTWNDKWKKEFNINSEQISIANPGYFKMKSGLIIQYGSVTSSLNNSDYRYFPAAFDNACISAVASYSHLDSSGMGASFQIVDKSRFLLGCRLSNGQLIQGTINWIATGY